MHKKSYTTEIVDSSSSRLKFVTSKALHLMRHISRNLSSVDVLVLMFIGFFVVAPFSLEPLVLEVIP